jgi:general secretion pathway protein D
MNKKYDMSQKNFFLIPLFYLVITITCAAQTEDAQDLVAEKIKSTAYQALGPIESVSEIDIAQDVYLGKFTHPWEFGDPSELLEFSFEDAEISGFIKYIEERFGLTFILDDMLKTPGPTPKGSKSLLGTKITFKTHAPMTKKDTWALFLKFLDIAGATVVPGPAPTIYRITSIDPKSPIGAAKSPLPTYIGTNPQALPDNDMYIRYVYFARDISIDTVRSVLDTMRSAASPELIMIPELRGVIVTDKAYNIKSMFNIIVELDTVTMPETMSIIKLKRTDARKVAELYQAIIKEDEQKDTLAARIMGARRPQTLSYFDPGTRIIPEPRTNTLILLGTEESVKKIEDFIVHEIDKEIEKPYTPIHIYPLKHVKAEAVAKILSEVVKYQPESDAAKAGGVRNGDKFFKTGISIVPEKSGNRLIITADYESYLKIHEVLEKIDVEQPQVAIKVLIIDIDVTEAEQFGTQIRNKIPGVDGLISDNVNFQTSGLAGTSTVVENTVTNSTGATRLLGNLVTLATGGAVGSTYITLGADCFGVWGILRMLESFTTANVVANPFLVTTNNYPAQISLGEKRRILMSNTIAAAGTAAPAFDNLDATITVKITPQISYEGFINLKVIVTDNQFTSPIETNGNRIEREIATSVILANNEVLALGGLIKDTFTEVESKVPILGDIPIVGWLFKNKQKTKTRTSTIVLIAPEVIPTGDEDIAHKFTATIVKDAAASMVIADYKGQAMDPIHRWFFNDTVNEGVEEVEAFVDREKRYILPHQKEQSAKIKRLSDFL